MRLADEIASIVESTGFVSTAASMVGVDVGVIRYWLKVGRRELDRCSHVAEAANPEFDNHVYLFLAIQEAKALIMSEGVKVIRKAAKSDWRAAQSYLRQVHPEEWTPRKSESLDSNAKIELMLDRLEKRLGEDEFARVVSALHQEEEEL